MATVTGAISRSGTDLTFGQGNGLSLFVGGLEAGRRTWRRRVHTSDFATGEVETARTLDQTRDMVLRFRAKATSETNLATLIASLVDAVEQATWDLTLTVGTYDWPTLTCTCADTEVIFDIPHTRGLVATVVVYTTHNPNASGPL